MNLKQYLLKKRIDVVEFSIISGISITSLYRYLRGRKPHYKTARKIEDLTEGLVTIEELMGREDGKRAS